MQQQLDIFGKTSVDNSIEFLKRYEHPEGYYLGFSGGKDSIVTKHLMNLAKVKYKAYYSATGIDPPELTKYIKKHHPNVIWLRPKINFYHGVATKMPPTIFRRWCCDVLKKDPGIQIPLLHRVMGIRSEESSNRANRPNPDYHSKYKHYIYKPIFGWKTWEIWDFIETEKLPYCKLYDEGFERLGCIICPFICYPNSKKLEINRKRWPKQYAAFERAVKIFFERKKNDLRENTVEEYLETWYSGNKKRKPQKQLRLA